MPVDALPIPHEGIVSSLASPSLMQGILPVGITAKTCTTGPWTLPDGTVATGRATITCPVNFVHTPTGQAFASGDMSVRLVNGMASWDLCPTDQAGLTQTGWTYTLRVELNGARVQPDPLPFALLSSGAATVDLDKLTPVATSSGTVGVQIDTALAALLNDTTSATYATVLALITARTGFGAGA